MSASRRLVISALDPHAVLVLLEVGDRGGDLLLRIGRERLEVDRRLLRQRLLQTRHHRARRGAEQPERGFRFDGHLDVGEPQRLLRLIEHAACPRYARWPRRRSRTSSSSPWRSPAAKSAAGRLTPRPMACFTVTSTGPEPSSGNVRPANCASTILLISVKGTSIGTPMLTPPGVGGMMVILAGNGQSGLVSAEVMRVSASMPSVTVTAEASTLRLRRDRAGRLHLQPERRQRRAGAGALQRYRAAGLGPLHARVLLEAAIVADPRLRPRRPARRRSCRSAA